MTRPAASPASVLVLVLVAMLATAPRSAGAVSCKADGAACRTNQSCCSGACVDGAPPGSKPFGICCTPTTCAAHNAECGTIPNGTCPQSLDCGSCTRPNTCGGGGTANVCGCTPTTCAAQGKNCGTISDGCTGTLDCGTCTGSDTCGGGGTANVCGCTSRTCADVGASGGTISDGCGGTLDCAASCTDDGGCASTEFCLNGRCAPKSAFQRPCVGMNECRSGCCCGSTAIHEPGDFCDPRSLLNTFGSPGVCTTVAICESYGQLLADLGSDIFQRYFALAECPGASCGEDSDCPFSQVCTGGICRLKLPVGSGCEFSSECGPSKAAGEACCCTPSGGSSGTCDGQSHCIGSGGTCECSPGDVLRSFGGVCPGTSCGQDSQCVASGGLVFQFCTAGVCTPKAPGGAPCSFSAGCLADCCCSETDTCDTFDSSPCTCLP